MPNDKKIAVLKAIGWRAEPSNFRPHGALHDTPHFYLVDSKGRTRSGYYPAKDVWDDIPSGSAYLALLMDEGVKWAKKRGHSFRLMWFQASPECQARFFGANEFEAFAPDPATAIESALHQIIQEEK